MLESNTSKDLFLNEIAEMYVDGTISPSTTVSKIKEPGDLDRLLTIIDCRMQATTNLLKSRLKEASKKKNNPSGVFVKIKIRSKAEEQNEKK